MDSSPAHPLKGYLKNVLVIFSMQHSWNCCQGNARLNLHGHQRICKLKVEKDFSRLTLNLRENGCCSCVTQSQELWSNIGLWLPLHVELRVNGDMQGSAHQVQQAGTHVLCPATWEGYPWLSIWCRTESWNYQVKNHEVELLLIAIIHFIFFWIFIYVIAV